MNSVHGHDARGKVFTSERMDSLVVEPMEPAGRYALAGALRKCLGPLKLTAEGVLVPAQLAPNLLDLGESFKMVWTETAYRYAENRRKIAAVHHRVRQEVERIKQGGPAIAELLLSDLDDLRCLDGHQLVNVAAMCVDGSPGLCLFDEQGAGKTVTGIFAFDLLVKRNEVDLAIVIAPKSMISEWPSDLVNFKGDLYKVSVVSGGVREKSSALRHSADFFVTNFETVVTMEDEITAMVRARSGRALLIVDESFLVKNLDAKRTQAIRRLREWCDRAFVLCGTPAPNSPQDNIQQVNIVDFGSTFDGFDMPVDKDAASNLIQERVSEHALYVRHLKREVLPYLPEKVFERILVPLQAQQLRLYRGALRSLILDLQATDDESFQRQVSSYMARRMALLQICSHPSMVADGYEETPAKFLALDGLLEELIRERGEKVIVWSFFKYSLEELVQRYSCYGVVRYDGSVRSVKERREAVRRFQNDDTTRLLVANPSAAGAGLTLHRARFAIYESLSNQPAHYLQSLDRIHRRGQERAVSYFVLLAQDTLEIDEYDRLLCKEQGSQLLLGDVVEPSVTRERMLKDLVQAADRVGMGESVDEF
jgi:SNF2 family DNA or RNA helicase